ncbi:MAG: FliO/MopB family protein [Candidatus Rifleibacteriota bacterium]
MKKTLPGFLFFLFFSLTSIVYAQPVATEGNGLLASEPFLFDQPAVATLPFLIDSDPFGTSLRIVSALFAVIILALGLSWLIQRKGVLGGNVFGKVIGILPLDNRRFIYLVDVVGKILVLGVTENNINLLCEVTDKDTVDSLRLQGQTPVLPGMEKLFSFLRKSDQQSREEDFSPSGNENLDLRNTQEKNQDRIKKLNSLLIKRGQDEKQE